jgi:hypothetical protein
VLETALEADAEDRRRRCQVEVVLNELPALKLVVEA